MSSKTPTEQVIKKKIQRRRLVQADCEGQAQLRRAGKASPVAADPGSGRGEVLGLTSGCPRPPDDFRVNTGISGEASLLGLPIKGVEEQHSGPAAEESDILTLGAAWGRGLWPPTAPHGQGRPASVASTPRVGSRRPVGWGLTEGCRTTVPAAVL